MVIISILTFLLFVPLVLCIRKLPKYYLMWGVGLLVLYLVVSYINGFIYTFLPLRLDALSFHHFMVHASQNPENRVGIFTSMSYQANWYPSLVSYLYTLSDSILVGQSFSILAYVFSIPLLYAFLKKLNHQKYAIPVLLVFSLSPMHLIDRVGCLRESWELFLLMGAVWCYWEFLDRKNTALNLTLLVAALYFGSRLHYVFNYMTAFFLFALIYSAMLGPRRYILKTMDDKLLIKRASIVFFIMTSFFMEGINQSILGLLLKHTKDMVLTAQDLSSTTNTLYINIESPFGFFTPVEYFIKYMFYPFPWSIHSTTDLFAFFCVCIRSTLLAFSIYGLCIYKRPYLSIITPCLVIALFYSQGVSNYGTAFRHQLLTYWGLVILGVPTILDVLKERGVKYMPSIFISNKVKVS